MTPNLYGNLVANVVAGLTGGPGILPGVNVGDQCAVFEQARHSAVHAQDVGKGLHVCWRMWRLILTCRVVGSGPPMRCQMGESQQGVEIYVSLIYIGGPRLLACCSQPPVVH